jgi:sugar diacid utilization regulator
MPEQLVNLYTLSALSMRMLDSPGDQEILELATISMTALSPCRVVAAYLRHGQLLERSPQDGCPSNTELDAQVRALNGTEGPVTVGEGGWSIALALRGADEIYGYLVVCSDTEPSGEYQLMVRMLAQQAAVALANVAMRRRERRQAQRLRLLNAELSKVNGQLITAVARMRQQTSIQEALATVSASGGGEQGIADTLHEMTGLAVAVEDPFGNLRVWSGPGRPDPYPKPDAHRQQELLHRSARQGHPVRDRDRVVFTVQPRHEILGALALVDPGHAVGPGELLVLERGATALALELAHLRSLAEVELRLRRDLVDDLVTGTDADSAFTRSEAVGHDLHGPHYVVLIQWRGESPIETVVQATEQVVTDLRVNALVARRSTMVALLIAGTPPADELFAALSCQLGPAGAIGVGGRAQRPAELPRSLHEALRALEIKQNSISADGVTVYDELGLYRILGVGDSGVEIKRFVREWLGTLLDYDQDHHADLVNTLFQYLECGGSYDATARTLIIHRSTLRYRLQRIRDITGLDISGVDNRLNLHVAVRAWHVLSGGSGTPPHHQTET